MALLRGFVTSHLDCYRSATHLCLVPMSSPVPPPPYCQVLLFLKCKFNCDPLIKIIQSFPIAWWLKAQLLHMAYQCLPDLFPQPLNLTSLYLYSKARPRQNNLQCPQASMSSLMLFPLSGMLFLHVLLTPIHLQLRNHSLQNKLLNSPPSCWVKCPLGSRGDACSMDPITVAIDMCVSPVTLWNSRGQGPCGSSLIL